MTEGVVFYMGVFYMWYFILGKGEGGLCGIG